MLKPKRKRHLAKLQDRKVMGALVGGRVQPASGSMIGHKGDGRVPGRFRIETKYTTRSSYRLDVHDLLKVAGEAEHLEVPVLVLDFKESGSARTVARYAVVPFTYFEKVANAEADDDR